MLTVRGGRTCRCFHVGKVLKGVVVDRKIKVFLPIIMVEDEGVPSNNNGGVPTNSSGEG